MAAEPDADGWIVLWDVNDGTHHPGVPEEASRSLDDCPTPQAIVERHRRDEEICFVVMPGAALVSGDIPDAPIVAWWSLGPGEADGGDAPQQIEAITCRQLRRGAPNPVFIVYAPSLTEAGYQRLMAVGAHHFRDLPILDGRGVGRNPYDIEDAIRLMLPK